MAADWEGETHQTQETELYQWLEKWYERHKKYRGKILTEPIFDEIAIRSNDILRNGSLLRFYFWALDKIRIRLVPHGQALTDSIGILITDEKIEPKTKERLLAFFPSAIMDSPVLQISGIEINIADPHSLQIGASHFGTVLNGLIYNMVLFYVLNIDWENRDKTGEWFLNTMKSENKIMALENLISTYESKSCINQILNDFFKSHGNKITFTDIIPPFWIEYILADNQMFSSSSTTKNKIAESKLSESPRPTEVEGAIRLLSGYRKLEWFDKETKKWELFIFNERQAKIVKYLHEANNHELHIKTLLKDKLELVLEEYKMTKQFRRHPTWRKLIVKSNKKGYWRLNI